MTIQAVIFDMDGILIDSEPLWQQAEIEIFNKLGLNLTDETVVETQGMRLDKVVEYRYNEKPWQGRSLEDVTEDIHTRVIQLVKQNGKALPGVYSLLEFLQQQPIRIGLATSSDHRMIEAVTEKLGIDDYFEIKCSAMDEEYGKPHPAVFLTAAQELNVDPQQCLVIEDSVRGVIAAKAAEMICVCVPDHIFADDKRLVIADMILPTLEAFTTDIWDQLNNG